MARIRTIKPSFWTDPTIDKVSNDAALLFIGIWNFSDDYGYFPCTPKALHLVMPRFRAQAIQEICSSLARRGLIRCSRVAGIGQVVGWEHQKIKDRNASKWNNVEILWDAGEIDAPQSEKNGPVEESIGEERKGNPLPLFKGGVLVQESKPKKSSTKKTPDPRVVEVLAHLNAKAQTGFTSPQQLPARFTDGHSVEDCVRVLDFLAPNWLTSEKMAQHYCPKTIFAKKNFENYLEKATHGVAKFVPESVMADKEFASGLAGLLE